MKGSITMPSELEGKYFKEIYLEEKNKTIRLYRLEDLSNYNKIKRKTITRYFYSDDYIRIIVKEKLYNVFKDDELFYNNYVVFEELNKQFKAKSSRFLYILLILMILVLLINNVLVSLGYLVLIYISLKTLKFFNFRKYINYSMSVNYEDDLIKRNELFLNYAASDKDLDDKFIRKMFRELHFINKSLEKKKKKWKA